MWVIKLGGSVSQQHTLVDWLQLVARFGDGKVIIVPGGGLFADAVRDFQAMRTQYPTGHVHDAEAHALAVFAMDQMARSFVAMVPELVLVRNPLEIAERGWQHRGLVWLPSEMVLNPVLWADANLAESWDVTSDSLAAWLAHQLEASHLLLIKSDARLQTPQPTWSTAQLVTQQCLDPSFPQALHNNPCAAWVMHHTAVNQFQHGFSTECLQGRLVL